jgi:IPT/TIG domain
VVSGESGRGRVQVEQGRSGREHAHRYRRRRVGVGSGCLAAALLLLSAPVTVTTDAAAAPITVTVGLRPTITSISPKSGPAKGGTTVVLHGTELGHASSVKFGAKAAKVIKDTDSSITVTSPSQPVGTVNITVTTGKGTSAIAAADRFTYAPCSGPIKANTTIDAGVYVVSCTIDVPAGVTLTVGPGAVFKSAAKGQIDIEGSLHAIGTPASPITFTSVNDNSIGGKTGTGKPTAGGWGDIFAGGKGSVDLVHAAVKYAKYGVVTSSSGPVVVTDDTLTAISNEGLYVLGNPSPIVERNTATDVGSRTRGTPAYFVSTNRLNPTTLGGNKATGGWDLFEIGGSVGTKGTLPVAPTPWYLAGALDVPSAMKLTVAPGVVFKGSGFGSLSVQGTLDAVGTATEPITLTSVNDSSVGGMTGTGAPAAGDWGDILVSGAGSIDLVHAAISYAKYGVLTSGTGSIVVTDDTLASISDEGLYVVGNPSPAIERNAATGVGSLAGSAPAYFVSTNGLNPATLGGNTATGGWDLFAISGAVGANGTLPVSPTPWYLEFQLDIPSGRTLTVAAGAVLKGSTAGQVSVQGSLQATGTATHPITFTSVNDSTVGGTTGTGTPAAGDWLGILTSGSGSIHLVDTTVEFAVDGDT